MKQKNKHIVFLVPGFAESKTDTTCIPALQIYAADLQKHPTYEISIITFHYPTKKGLYYWNGIPVYALGGAKSFSKIILWKKAFQTLSHIHTTKIITNLHSFWLGECAFVGHWFSKKNNISHITTLMGQDALKGNFYSKILPLKKMKLISLSDFHQKTFYSNYNISAEIIPWGICMENFHPSEKTIDIIGIGSLIPLKNYTLFIDIIHRIHAVHPVQVVLIGDGILKSELQKKIRLHGLENAITIKGELDHKETLNYLSQSKILLHTSDYESFGLVFAEALQSNTMIVSKPVGCYFNSPNWTTSNDKKEMAEACLSFLSKSFTENEQNSFTIENTVQSYLKVYNE